MHFNQILYVASNKQMETNYDLSTGHIIYNRKTKKNLIESMVDQINSVMDIRVEYIKDFYSIYQGPIESLDVPDKFILMPSCGKKDRISSYKDWGFQNLNALARLLYDKGYKVVQIGQVTDAHLNCCEYRFFDLSLSQLHFLMSKCSFFIGLLNGLSVYAGHHSVRTYLLHYKNPLNFSATMYKNQESINVNSLFPEDVLDFILQKELVKHL